MAPFRLSDDGGAMKIFITGHTPRSANPGFRRRVGIAQLLVAGYRTTGHDVTVGHWLPSDPSEPFPPEYDLVLVGLSSPLAPGAAYTFPAMATLHALWGQDRLVVFPEDPAVWKIKNGNLSALREPKRLYSPYLNGRIDYATVVGSPALRRYIEQAARLVTDTDTDRRWPRYLVPAFEGADLDRLLSYAPSAATNRPVPIDPTQIYLDQYATKLAAQPSTVDVWLTESKPTDDGLNRVVTTHPRVEVRTYDDAAFGTALAPALGVLEHSNECGKLIGSWSPTPAIATAVRSFFHGWPETYDRLGDAYRVLPSAFEDMDASAREDALTWQRTTLNEATTPLTNVLGTLTSLGEQP